MSDWSLFDGGLKVELNEDIKLRVMNYRNRFFNLFLSRYMELLPQVITYKYDDPFLDSVDWLKVEIALRNNFNVILGLNALGRLSFLGYTANPSGITNPQNFFLNSVLRYDDIVFIIPDELRPNPEDFHEITPMDGGQTGSFVVLRNKPLNFLHDTNVIRQFAETLTEIQVSRYSLILQSKMTTFFKSEVNDESINQVVTDLYNGAPYIKTSLEFDEENIVSLDNKDMSLMLTELKREYQNQLNELNSMVGVDSLGVDKESGVSDIEAKSGNPFSKNIANIYLNARNNPLKLLRDRFGFDITAEFDNNVKGELTQDFLIDKENIDVDEGHQGGA